jgi:hypothetical protein
MTSSSSSTTGVTLSSIELSIDDFSLATRRVLGDVLCRELGDVLDSARAESRITASTIDVVDNALAALGRLDTDATASADAVRRRRNCVWAMRVVCCRLFSHRRSNSVNSVNSVNMNDPLLSLRCSTLRVLESRRLSRLLDDWCGETRRRAPKDALTRWLLTSRLLEPADGGDWLIPARGGRDGGLEHELYRTGLHRADAALMADRLGAAAQLAVLRLMRVADAEQRGDLARADALLVAAGDDRELIRAAKELSDERRSDLRARFALSGLPEAEFERRVVAMTMSYAAMSGEATHGEGYHGAITRRTFDALAAHCGVQAECFASPLNCTLPQYWSAFGRSVDGCFGSLGSFFDAPAREHILARGGVFEANPPFLEEHMLAMAIAIELYLTRCTVPLAFVVFVPQWRDSPYFELLSASSFKRAYADLAKGEHQYIRGLSAPRQRSATTVAKNDVVRTQHRVLHAKRGRVPSKAIRQCCD